MVSMAPHNPLPQPLEAYGVDPITGFLPSTAPALNFEDEEYYRPWEKIMASYQGLLLAGRLREKIDALPILDTERLAKTDDVDLARSQQRRAFLILCMLGHGYVWGNASEKAKEHVPASISVPWLHLSDDLGVCPVVCHAAVVLWNWRTIDDPKDLSLDNLATLFTYTGATDESWFYLVTTAVEAVGAPALPALLAAISACSRRPAEDLSDNYFNVTNAAQNDQSVVRALEKVEEVLSNVNATLKRMYDHCDPSFFYWKIRPHLAGWENMAVAGLPSGVHYENLEEYETRQRHGWTLDAYDDDRMTSVLQTPARFLKFAGGSAGQSSLIQAFDIALGVEHRATGVKKDHTKQRGEHESDRHDTFKLPSPIRRFDFRSSDNVYNTRASFANDFITERIVHGDTYGSPLVRPTRMNSSKLAPVLEESLPEVLESEDSAGSVSGSGSVSSGPSTPSDSPALDLKLGKGKDDVPVLGPPGASQVANDAGSKANNFISTMRSYMPSPHRLFLEDLAKVASIRSYVIARAVEAMETGMHVDSAKEVLRQYNAILYQLKLFRDIHIRIVTLYIVLQARKGPSIASGSHGIARRFSEAREDREAMPAVPALQSVATSKEKEHEKTGYLDIEDELDNLLILDLPGAYPDDLSTRNAKSDYFGDTDATSAKPRVATTPGGTILYPQRVVPSATGNSNSMELARQISQDDKDILRGTGGTDLSRFLAQARDETAETCAPDIWATLDIDGRHFEVGDPRRDLADELVEEEKKTKERHRQRNLDLGRQWAEGICCGT